MNSIDKKQNIICIIDPVFRDIIIYVDSLFWSGLSGLKCHKSFKLPLNYNHDMSKTKKNNKTNKRQKVSGFKCLRKFFLYKHFYQ